MGKTITEHRLADQSGQEMQWFVMRDLKRHNARLPAWLQLREAGFHVFTPMRRDIPRSKGCGKPVAGDVPVIRDLLFVRSSRESLDPVVLRTPTLQYRFVRNAWHRPMTVAEREMDFFMRAVAAVPVPRYYLPEELTPDMCRRRMRIIGGTLDGLEGRLLNFRGSRKRRLLIELPGILAVGVEVSPDCIQLLD